MISRIVNAFSYFVEERPNLFITLLGFTFFGIADIVLNDNWGTVFILYGLTCVVYAFLSSVNETTNRR